MPAGCQKHCLTSVWFVSPPPGEQLQINQPDVYDCDVPESLASLVPALAAVCKKTQRLSGLISPHAKPVSNRSVTLTSKGGTDFISFAKGSSFKNGTTLKELPQYSVCLGFTSSSLTSLMWCNPMWALHVHKTALFLLLCSFFFRAKLQTKTQNKARMSYVKTWMQNI